MEINNLTNQGIINLLIIGLAVVAGILVQTSRAQTKSGRRAAMDRFAQLKGFFRADRPGAFCSGEEPWMNSYLFLSQSRKREFLNILKGRFDGRQWILFDFYVLNGYGIGTVEANFPGAAVEFPGTKIPGFVMFNRTAWFSPWIPRAGFPAKNNISFGDEVFESKYSVQGKDEKTIRALFSPGLRKALSEAPRFWFLEGAGDWLLVYYFVGWKPFSPEEDFRDISGIVRHFSAAVKS